MAFRNYLEGEDDAPYYKLNSLAHYYEEMERYAALIKEMTGYIKDYGYELGLTKEEIDQRVTAYILENKVQLDQRLGEWDEKLQQFDGSVTDLLAEWVDDGTLNHIIDTTLIDEKIQPLTALLAVTSSQVDTKAKESYMQEMIKKSNIYNLDHLKNWKVKRAQMFDQNVKAHVAVWGDSITEGFYAEFPATIAMRDELGYIGQVHQYYKKNLHDAGEGWAQAYPASDMLNRWRKTGTWTITESVITKAAMRSTKVDSFAELDFSGTGISIVFSKKTFASTADIYIDGVFNQSVNTLGTAPQTTMTVTIDGLTNGNHVLKIVQTKDGQYLDIIGAVPIKGSKGIVFYNFSRSGNTTSRLNETVVNNAVESLNLFDFDLTIIAYHTNDIANITQADYRTRLESYVDIALAGGSEVILIAQGAKADMTNFSKLVAYRNIMKQVADKKGACFIDFVGRWAIGDESGKLPAHLFDLDHFNLKGHTDLATMLIKALEAY